MLILCVRSDELISILSIATFVLVILIVFLGGAYYNTSTTAPAWSPYNLDMTGVLTPGKSDTSTPWRTGTLRIATVPGFFVHDDPHADPANYHYDRPVSQGGSVLGLLNRPYQIVDGTSHTSGFQTQWQKFETWLNETNVNAPPNVVYKLIVMGRHGQGEHNVAEAKYGTIQWDVSNLAIGRQFNILTCRM